MDNEIIGGEKCSTIIYSEDYVNLILRYDNKSGGIYDFINPECTTVVDNFFLVAYKRNSDKRFDNIFDYGYDTIPKCYGLMDDSVVIETGVDRIRNLSGLSLTGKGTLVGFVDTGIDYINPVFRNINGTTRIKAIWDQNVNVFGSGKPVYGYGAEYLEEDINNAISSTDPFSVVPTKDENGHGTFLASVCAGSEDLEGELHSMAPESEILVVKLKPAKKNLKNYYFINKDAVCYGEDDIILGIKYLVSKAIMLGRPIAICIGLGTNQGDHNGNTVLEAYINSISNIRGVSVIVSAGNELGYNTHFSSNAIYNYGQNSNRIEINVGENEPGFIMEIWGNAPNLLSVTVQSPTGERLNSIVPQRNDEVVLRFLYEGSILYVNNIVVEASSGDQLVFFRFENPTAGIWTLFIDEAFPNYIGGYDAWLPIKAFLSANTMFVRGDPNVTICSPGNSSGAITVSGYNHINNAIYINSSRGYTRKNRIKPDLAAPAVDVFGVFARGVQSNKVLFTSKSGTSVAAAVCTGAASLILEWAIVNGNRPNINNEVVKQLLIRGADKAVLGEYPNPEFGWGTLDVLGAFANMRNM